MQLVENNKLWRYLEKKLIRLIIIYGNELI